MQKRTPANTAEMSMLSALVMSAHTAERRSDHITWKQNSLSQMLPKNKKGVNNKCHIHREEALGPMKVMPHFSHILAKDGFSDRKPKPGWIASAPVISQAEIIALTLR